MPSADQVVLTRGGYEMMKQKLRYLKTDRIQEVAAKLEKARGFGDLSENAEYAAAKEELSQLDKQINDLQATLSGSVKIKDNEDLDTSRVGIGVVVTLEDLDHDNKIYKYMLVGSEELSILADIQSDLSVQCISQKSPVGHAILNETQGSIVEVKIPKGTRNLKIISIDKPEETEF